MFDVELLKGILQQIQTATETIQTRFQPIKTHSDFTNTPDGIEKLEEGG